MSTPQAASVPGVYNVVSQQPTVEIIGPTLTRQAVEVSAVEIPDGVFFTLRVPRNEWLAGAGDAELYYFAQQIQQIMVEPSVIGADFSQSVDAAGHIHDFLDIEVSPDGGDNTAILHQPFGQLDTSFVFPQIQYLVGVLQSYLTGSAPPAPPPPGGSGRIA